MTRTKEKTSRFNPRSCELTGSTAFVRRPSCRKRFWNISSDFYMTKVSGGLQMIVDVIEEKDLADSTIGLEMSNDIHARLGLEDFQQLWELTSGVRRIDSSDASVEVRAVKSPAEIEKLRKVAQINAQAVKEELETMSDGMTNSYQRVDRFSRTVCRMILFSAAEFIMGIDHPCQHLVDSGGIVTLKSVMKFLGFVCGVPRGPFPQIDQPSVDRIHQQLTQIDFFSDPFYCGWTKGRK